jgi:preprotein translocase subunit SecE
MDNEKTNHSIVNAGLVAAGFLAYLVTAMVFEALAGAFGPVARFHNQEMFKHGLPVAVGLLFFLALFLNTKAHVFLDEAVTEVRKVVWPSRKDTTAMTIVCCVMVVAAGIGFGIFDFMASQLIKVFVN